ncbi:MAG: HAD domain-containing protein [Clostridia bacterium]|nr:HAD domain-containing protein [Clostridia bacterium]
MKVIFLDIDGVLNSHKYDAERDWNVLSFIDETRLPLLKSVIDATGAVVVLTSTWRVEWDRDESGRTPDGKYISDTFDKFGIDIFDKTPDLGMSADRADEIREWLSGRTDVDRYVIIDDCRYDWREMTDCVVKTNAYIGRGLEHSHVAAAIAGLNGEDRE